MSELELLKLQVLGQLKCPVCKEYLLPPVKQCASGHSVCCSCIVNLNECTLCKALFTQARNYVVEELIEKIQMTCPKCKRPLPLTAKDHKYQCPGEEINCQINTCGWIGERRLIRDHICDKHKGQFHIDGFVNIKFQQQFTTHVLLFKSHYFWVKQLYVGGQYFWTAQDIYQWENNQKFYFTIKVICKDFVAQFSQPCMPNSALLVNSIQDRFLGIQSNLINGKNVNIVLCITDRCDLNGAILGKKRKC